MRLRVGLVGAGDAAAHHARALAALDRAGTLAFAAVHARDPARGARFLRSLGLDVPLLSLDELLERSDAVVLATPDGVHVEGVLRAASAGRHVLVEKPLACARAEGEAARDACARAGVHLAVAHHLRFHAGHRASVMRLEELVGTPRHLSLHWTWPDPAVDGWRARGEGAVSWALSALGVHLVDLALWLVGPLRLVAAVDERAGPVDVAVAALLQGLGATVHLSTSVRYRSSPRVVVSGDRGELEWLGTLGARGTGEVLHRTGRSVEPLRFEPEDPYAAQLRAFAAWCTGERPWVGAPLDDVLAGLSLVDELRARCPPGART